MNNEGPNSPSKEPTIRDRRTAPQDRLFHFLMVVIMLFTIFAYVEFYLTRRPATFRYLTVDLPDAGTLYCPGEALDYDVRLDVARPPSSVAVVRSLWNLDTGRLADMSEVIPPFAARVPGEVVNPLPRFKVPQGTPPGNYRLDVVAHDSTGKISDFGIIFAVPPDCGGTP